MKNRQYYINEVARLERQVSMLEQEIANLESIAPRKKIKPISQCVIPTCAKPFSQGRGRPRRFCSDPCYKRFHNEYNKLYIKHVARAKPDLKGQKRENCMKWIQGEALKRLLYPEG